MEVVKEQGNGNSIPLTKEELLMKANIQLRFDLLCSEAEKLKLENRELERSIVDRAGIDLKDWVIDLGRGSLIRK